MKVLEISLFYYPDKTGIAVTSTETAEWFAAKGENVTVLTGLPFYPEWKIDEEYKSRSKRNQLINNVNVIRTNLYVPSKVTSITRIFHELSFSLNVLLRALRLSKPDLIIIVSPPLALGIVGLLLKILWKTKVLFNVQDLVPDAAIELNMLKNRYFIKILYILEKIIYKNVDAVASLGCGILERIKNKGVEESKLVYLPLAADPFLINYPQKSKAENQFFIKNNLKTEFFVLHAGNMGVKQGIDIIIKTAKILKDYRITFCIVGDGAVKDDILKLTQQFELNNIIFLPLQPRELLAEMYHASDICLLTQKKEVVDIVIPSKLISMMAAGSCVVASVNSECEASKIVKDAECGIVTEPENPDSLAKGILYYYNNKSEIVTKRANAKLYVKKHYDKDKIMNDYHSILKDLISNSCTDE